MRLGGNRRWVPLIRGHTVSDFFSVKELFELRGKLLETNKLTSELGFRVRFRAGFSR